MELQKEDFGIFRSGYAAQAEFGFCPRIDNKPIRLSLPLDWDMDPFMDRNWRFQLHAWRMLDPIWEQFYGSDWSRLREEILPWVRDWHTYHMRGKREAAFSWYDMSAGFRAQHLALLVHLHRNGSMPLASADMAIIESLSVEHVKRLRDPDFIAMNNHGLFQLKGLRLLGVVWEGYEFCKGESAYSTELMERLLDFQFDSHGVHVENSPDYHGFMLKQFSRIRPGLFPDIAEKLAQTISKAQEVLPWFTFPDRSIAAIGDSQGLSTHLSPKAKPDARLTSTAGDSIFVRDMTASGYAVVRSAPGIDPTRASMLVVKGQALSDTHAHADHLGFILYAGGRHLLVDSGKYSYNKDNWREYFLSDRAHNVVGLAQQSFGPQNTTTQGPGLTGLRLAEGGQVVIEGEIVRREFFRHRRRIVYTPAARIEINDKVEARAGDAPIAYWHLAPGIDAERIDGGIEFFDNGTRLARMSVDSAAIKARLIYGQEKPKIQGWVSPTYKQKTQSVAIEYRAPVDCQEINTLIELFDSSPATAPDELPRRLVHGIRFNFQYLFRSDRIEVLPNGSTRRRVIVELPEANAIQAGKRLSAKMELKGFEPVKRIKQSGGFRMEFAHQDGTHASAVLRDRESEANGGAGTASTLNFSWGRSTSIVPAAADAQKPKLGESGDTKGGR